MNWLEHCYLFIIKCKQKGFKCNHDDFLAEGLYTINSIHSLYFIKTVDSCIKQNSSEPDSNISFQLVMFKWEDAYIIKRSNLKQA